MTLHAHFILHFNPKKVITVGKKTPKNIIFFIHTILFLVIYSTDK